jgi:hypothetical protein
MRAALVVCVTVIGVSLAARVDAQTIHYRALTLDIQVGDTLLRSPQDLNNRGDVLANLITFADVLGSEVIAGPALRHRREASVKAIFSCANLPYTNTMGRSINARGDTVGDCSMGPLGSDPRHGFLRHKNGHVLFIDVPGATQTIPTGISNDRQVVGFYYDVPDFSRSGLYRIHGFRWIDGNFETIDLDLPDTYTMLRSVNSRGQIIGDFTRFVPSTNATLQHGWFIYENGRFSFPFPDTLEWMGGPAIDLADINDAGEVVATRSNAGAGWNGLVLYKEGTFFDIQLPPEFEFPVINGMNDQAEIVGTYLRKASFDPFYGAWLYETHGFVARPRLGKGKGAPEHSSSD